MDMFCYQCQEAAGGKGCTVKGVCGKTPRVAKMQDLLVYALSGLAFYSSHARKAGLSVKKADTVIIDGLFATITNANFDYDYFVRRVREVEILRDELKSALDGAGQKLDKVPAWVKWSHYTEEEMELKAATVGVLRTGNEDVRSLRELITYGLKGMAAYAHHAAVLGHTDSGISAFMEKALIAIQDDSLSGGDLTALTIETGDWGVKVMALLDKANTSSYGNPEISTVNLGVRNNPGILVSGHDLKDLEELLAQSEGSGVDIYTHSEMLPAHYYPAFKKYKHFAGNYGNAWWKQTEEFEKFNGPVLLTTNCLVPPKESYKDRVYTTGVAGFSGVKHIADREAGGRKDWSAIISHAKKCPPPVELEQGTIVGGFAHAQVEKLAGKVVDAVKSGAVRKFIVMAGCDGRMQNRGYYTDFAEKLPGDTIILTAGCAKYRYNKLNLGDIGGIPRVLDAGQCNDSYSLAVTALKLKEAFGLSDVNELPISYNIAWYEQKAVIVLLALLALGVKNIHLGPTLPAFLSPGVADVLVKNFGIAGIGSVDADIKLLA